MIFTTESDKVLEQLAESFSSDVINEAISEIIAEEDLKVSPHIIVYIAMYM